MADHRTDWPDGKAPTEWVNPEVHTMRCTASIGGRNAIFDADLVFVSGCPYAVFEWDEYEGGMAIPSTVVQLDPQFLKALPESWAPVRWLYEMPLEDPRRLH